MNKGMYMDGTTLEKILNPKAFRVLKKYAEENNISIASLSRLKPWMVVMTLSALELQKMGVNQSGIDFYFYEKAHTDGKKTGGLENIEKHIEIITSIDVGVVNDFILQSIEDFKKSRELVDGIISAWKLGNESKLDEIFLDQMRKDSPRLYNSLLVERNNNWIPKIESYVQTPEVEMIVVGVGHLVGEDGIIDLLKKRSYQVEKFSMSENKGKSHKKIFQ
jgi:uncharacterized protein YbaP (TraB family)